MSIKKELLSGTLFTALSRYVYVVVSLIVTAILARLLTPEDFGVIAIATVLIAFINLFCDMGFGPAIIQNKNLTENDISNIFIFSIVLGSLLALFLFLSSDTISIFYGKKKLSIICKILSANIFFTALNIVPKALILKKKEFKFIAKRNVIVNILLGFISVIAAYKGLGIYALLINPLGTSLILFVINFKKVKIGFPTNFSIEPLNKIIRFSTFQFLFNFINFFSRNLDQLLIGKYISLVQLGYYEKSYRLMQQPIGNIANVITPVMHPILSEYQNQKDKLLNYSRKIVKVLALVGFCITPFLYFTADELIIIVFGNDWIDAIPVFRILSISVCFQMINSASGSILQSGNNSKYLFLSGLVNSFLNVTGIILGVFIYREITIVASFIVITFGLNLIVSYYFIYKKMFGISFIIELTKLIKPLVFGCIISVFLYGINTLGFSFIPGLILKISLGLIVMLVMYWCNKKGLLKFRE